MKEQLEEAKKLFEEKLITEEEYLLKKEKILSKENTKPKKDNGKHEIKPWIAIVIIFGIIAAALIYLFSSQGAFENKDLENIETDARRIITAANEQYAERKDIINNCISIDGFDPSTCEYKNCANYTGSVLVDEYDVSKTEIWLSDGKYRAEGTKNNIIIYESTLEANKKCGQY